MINGIRYYSFSGASGYGEAALAYIECLLAEGISISWSPMVPTQWGSAPWHLLPDHMKPGIGEIEHSLHGRLELLQCLGREIDYDTVFIHTVPELWPKLVEPDKKNIGYTVWETDQLPAHWPAVLNSVDRICVPCEYNRKMFSLGKGAPVSVVPHAVRRSSQQVSEDECREFRVEHDIAEDMYLFYVISTWDPRKAMPETLHAFLMAFDADDNVCLLIKTDEEGCYDHTARRKATREMLDSILENYPSPAKIKLIDARVPDRDIQIIHATGDCFFSLTHSEGWGLGAFDAAASGNPVVITGWGGQLDFLPADSSYHVRYDFRTLQETKGWDSYTKNQKWAFADLDDAVRQLQHCYQYQREAKEKGLHLQAFVNNSFSFEQVTLSLLGAIDEAHSG